MDFELNLKANTAEIEELYNNHQHFHKGDSGLDLYCPEDIIIPGNEMGTINFGIKCEASSGYWLIPRSSITKTPLRMANSIGVIDIGYRGDIMAKVDNIKNEEYHIEKGTRLFQIVAPTHSPIKFTVVKELSETSRGVGGFGSTGI